MEAVDKTLMDLLNAQDYNMAEKFKTDNSLPRSPTNLDDKRKRKIDTEAFYFQVRRILEFSTQPFHMYLNFLS